MINLVIQILSINKINLIKYKYSNVTLKIKGTGNKNVYTSTQWLTDFPNEVFIKEEKQNDISPKYDFVDEETTVKLVWYNNIKYGACIFCI
jgi:hypothetical protein